MFLRVYVTSHQVQELSEAFAVLKSVNIFLCCMLDERGVLQQQEQETGGGDEWCWPGKQG